MYLSYYRCKYCVYASQVKHVYERCGFDASSSPTTLYMLSDLEARLEDLLSDIGQMPEEYVAKAEKVYFYTVQQRDESSTLVFAETVAYMP